MMVSLCLVLDGGWLSGFGSVSSGPLPTCRLGGWVMFSFLGSVLELMSVESQRGLGFGMRIQGL